MTSAHIWLLYLYYIQSPSNLNQSLASLVLHLWFGPNSRYGILGRVKNSIHEKIKKDVEKKTRTITRSCSTCTLNRKTWINFKCLTSTKCIICKSSKGTSKTKKLRLLANMFLSFFLRYIGKYFEPAEPRVKAICNTFKNFFIWLQCWKYQLYIGKNSYWK